MRTEIVREEKRLLELRDAWDRLPQAAPTQSPNWLMPWWDSYGLEACESGRRELFVISVFDAADALRGIAPFYLDHRPVFGPTLRWLGDGRACSDHPSILSGDDDVDAVVDSVADTLRQTQRNEWNSIRLESVDTDDRAANALIRRLQNFTLSCRRNDEAGSCFMELPDSWDEYLQSLTKNHRKRCRRWHREFFETNRIRIELIESPQALNRAWSHLVRLHNERRHDVGESGAFEDPLFHVFHEQALEPLLKSDRLWLQTLELDGNVVAIEYALQDATAIYAYQSGLDSEGAKSGAGNLSLMSLIRGAIESGKRRFDFMRGTEAYKFHWGAQVRPAQTVTIQSRSAGGVANWVVGQTVSQLRKVKRLCSTARP